jgi:hypothetical protein
LYSSHRHQQAPLIRQQAERPRQGIVRESGGMNWLSTHYPLRFSLRTLLLAFLAVGMFASIYLVGRQQGTTEGYRLGYTSGVKAADDHQKAEYKRVASEANQYAAELQKAEQEIVVLKLEAKKKSNFIQ